MAGVKETKTDAQEKKTPDAILRKRGHGPVVNPNGGKILVSFYDARTLAPLSPAPLSNNNQMYMEILKPDGTPLKGSGPEGSFPVTPDTKEKGAYWIDLSEISLSELEPAADPNQDTTENIELPCGVPRTGSPTVMLNRFTEAVQANCQTYQMAGGMTTDFQTGGQEACSRVPVAMTELEESYTLGLIAYDNCIGDFIRHPEALMDDVRLELREVQTQKHASGSKTNFQGRSFSTTTKDGYGEITGLTPGQAYEARISAHSRYVCTNPPAPRFVHFSGSNLLWQIPFQPCGEFPARSVIFVQQACPGMRAANLSFQASGVYPPPSTDQHGIWNIPKGTTGRIDFQSPGNVFSPAYIYLDKDSPMVLTVAVADQQVAQLGSGKRRFQFVDEKGQAFPHRQLHLVYRDGHEETVRTDEGGWFWAEEGCLASAEEDEYGFALDRFPLLTTQI
ncbi:MAG: hypothetical protein ABSH02_13020 [Candidatus Sulfotelmatobacter sp.]|jgi:hypothetical protein